MKIDLSFKIQRLDGTDFKDLEPDGVNDEGQPKFKEGKPLTLRKACVDALTIPGQKDQDVGPKIKALRGWLAQTIYNCKESTIELPSEDINTLKAMIGNRYNPLIVMLAWNILDPDWRK